MDTGGAVAFIAFSALNAMALFLCPFSFQEEKSRPAPAFFVFCVCHALIGKKTACNGFVP